jgi:hypothetical protein
MKELSIAKANSYRSRVPLDVEGKKDKIIRIKRGERQG